jgi:non-ribosomal peptide synthase protein (TIGR01720 family)
VRLDAGRSAGEAFWRGGAAAGSLLTRVRDQLRRARAAGPDYGLLRHLNQDTAAALAAVPEPDLGFNYLGRFTDEELGEGGPGPLTADGPPAAHLVELDVVAEADRLLATWSWPAGSVREDEIRRLGDLWFAALDVLVELASGDRISTAFPLVDLTDDQIDALAVGLDDADGGTRW